LISLINYLFTTITQFKPKMVQYNIRKNLNKDLGLH
jgi:hypothetical protein